MARRVRKRELIARIGILSLAPSLRSEYNRGMGILPDNLVHVLIIIWVEWMSTRPPYWSVYGEMTANHVRIRQG